MVKSLTASLVSREEEERHQRNLNDDEQLKNEIAGPWSAYSTEKSSFPLVFAGEAVPTSQSVFFYPHALCIFLE